MTDFHFDEVIDRRRTDSIKFDFYEAYSMPEDAIPLWVADMDFRSPPAVIDALKTAADFGVFGYTYSSDRYFKTVCRWYAERHDWNPQPDWIVPTPGVMFAAATAVRVLTRPGEAVLIQQPVYYPFQKSVEENGRVCVVNELRYTDGTYSIDFDDFERKIIECGVRLFLLCSPHNPVGRVWTDGELTRMAAICRRHDVFIAADEIHSDLILSDRPHRVFASLDPVTAERTAVLTSPTKTFNLPGLHVANAFIPNAEIRRRFTEECLRLFYYGNDLPGLRATEAAYTEGGEWLDALLIYLRENVRMMTESLARMGGKIRPVPPEATYLMWFDCRRLGLDDEALLRFFGQNARLWPHRGIVFGRGGDGFVRVNIAVPRSILAEVIRRLADAQASLPTSDRAKTAL